MEISVRRRGNSAATQTITFTVSLCLYFFLFFKEEFGGCLRLSPVKGRLTERGRRRQRQKEEAETEGGPVTVTDDHRQLFEDGSKFSSSSGERNSPGGSSERQTAAKH